MFYSFRKSYRSKVKNMNSPDRRWRWVVLLCCFISIMLNSAIFFAFGTFVLPWMNEFAATGASVAVVTSCGAAISAVGCAFGSALIQIWGFRWTHVIGGSLLVLSFASSSFAQSITQLFFTYSVLGGLGSALCMSSYVVAISEHFHDQQGFGFAIATSAYGLGGFVFPLLFEYLVINYTWRGAMFIAAGICGHIIPCGLLLYPVDRTPRVLVYTKDDSTDQKNLDNNNIINSDEKLSVKSFTKEDVDTVRRNSSEDDKLTFFQLTKILLKTGSFYIMVFHNIFLYMGYFIVLGVTPMRASYDLNLSNVQSAQLMSAFGINAIFRLIIGVVAQMKLIRCSVLYLTGFGIAGILATFSFLANTFSLQLIYCLASAALFSPLSHYNQLIYEIYGRTLFNTAFGILESMHGIGIATGPMIGGFLFDVTGTCVYSFVFAGLSMIFAVAILPLGLALTNDFKKLNF